jgi:hypothetical protein
MNAVTILEPVPAGALTLCHVAAWMEKSAVSWRMHTKRMADIISTCRR